MSLFKRKGPTSVEIAHQNDIKQNITKELSSCVKRIQREQQLNSDGLILSTDSANAICNILESIFLHGCKPPVSKKIANYIGINQGYENGALQLNFWLFCERFTHSDVVAQLKRLAQVNTEIGLCRAWIRVALNDGLMESYVNAMVADRRSLEYFYSSTSYFRDHEQPGIFLSYLKGLMSYEFQLSYNSSVLNNWPNSSLVLAGLIDAENTPLPVIHPKRASGKPEIEQREEEVETINPVNRQKVRTKKRTSLDDGGLSPLPQGRSVSEYSSELTQEDVDKIRGMKPRNKSRSECSSSSRVSCPDPVKYNRNPASYVTDHVNDSEPMFDDDDEAGALSKDSGSHNTTVKQNDERIDQMSPSVNLPSDSELSSPGKPSLNDPSSYGELSYSSASGELVDCKDLEEDSYCDTDGSGLHISPLEMNGYEDIHECLEESKDTQSEHEKTQPVLISENKASEIILSPQQQDFVNERILEDILNTELSSPSDKRDHVTSDSSYDNSKDDSLDEKAKARKRSKGKKENLKPEFNVAPRDIVQPQLSPAVADAIETTMMDQTTKKRFSVGNEEDEDFSSSPRRPRSGALSVCLEPENNDGVGISSPPSVGNSLGARSGWSSDFEQPVRPTTIATMPVRNKSESFNSLLKNYTPSSQVASPTMEDVLQELPEYSNISSSSPQVDLTFSTSQDSQNQASLLGVIANEKGLDAQNYQCGSCKRPIGFIYGKPRVCTFDGKYYCFECHENEEYYIPAFIIHNWDFRKHIVSKKSLTFLQDIEDHSIIDVYVVNPRLYEHIKEMDQLQVLRKQLCHLKTYLFTCKQSTADEFRKSMWPKEYLYEGIHTYTLADLLQVPSGQLIQSLKKSIKFATKHVYECPLCSGKGFICELCHNPKVIYPFQTDNTIRCPKCKSVFHKACKSDSKSCPKCARRSKRKSQTGDCLETPDIHDYAFTPQLVT
ncbi:pleckstrin homology domain-containing family M member 1-like isoform X2 [Saccostrea echinata]|uniref:pleckstrin homology domain-containing family M member 1-like isoform X2 n=1 Tax=Saccostrea echinata TaxID=191078 RepID=UPI002A80BACE|nr:pleckstrin homology domain-containing family M member 1-like isoform X2 [Saccostrea echinata]